MIKGIAISGGIGIGKIINIESGFDLSAESISQEEVTYENELDKLKEAISQFTSETYELISIMNEKNMQRESEILTAHMAILEDKYTYNEISSLVEDGKSAREAVTEYFEELYEFFIESDDQVMKNRCEDFADIKERLVDILSGNKQRKLDFDNLKREKGILLVDELRPSLAALLDKGKVAGVIARKGGYTSHSAIMLRSKGISAVFGVKEAKEVGDDVLAIVDGERGQVFIDPPMEVLLDYENKVKIEKQLDSSKEYYKKASTMTACGKSKVVLANISSVNQAKEAIEFGGEGAGLYRTEYLFMDSKAPTEEEQVKVYEEIARIFEGREVVIRTLDIGADKESCLKIPKEDNPFLGQRGVRFCLNHKDIFKVQLRSLLRAARLGNIKICFPMISSVEEIRAIKSIIEECKLELLEENLEFSNNPLLGIMLETPSSCIMAGELADEVDFLSLGTNDLTGYVMAVDRGNLAVYDLYSMYNPAVIRLIKFACEAVHNKNKEISICGEAASDIKLLPILLGVGIDKLSVGGENIWRVRREISRWKLCDAEDVLKKVLSMATKAEVESYLSEIFEGGKENGN